MTTVEQRQDQWELNGNQAPSRVMVVSTPKTGNTWTKHLLSAIYDLPLEPLKVTFKEDDMAALGQRWIGQQHFYPLPRLLRWAEENDVVLVTTVRHPGDTFLSLYHYTRNFGEQPRHDQVLLQAAEQDGGELGENVTLYVRDRFFCYLNVSIAWLQSERSHVLRYEELWRDPVQTLTELTARIGPVSRERIEQAVRRSDIRALRKKRGHDPRFFHRGQVGSWREVLPPEIVEVFATVDPYPAQSAALGYTLDPADPLIDAPPRPRPEAGAVLELSAFDNGVPFTPIFVDLYLSVDRRTSRGWPNPEVTEGADTYFNWLNRPADEDPAKDTNQPLVTNLARYLHFVQRDIRHKYPDLFGQDRIGYLMWFLKVARGAYELDEAFVQPVSESFTRWAVQPSAADPHLGRVPLVTNLAAELHRSRQDLQLQWPDIYDEDRVEFARWFIQHPQWEYGFPRECLMPVLLSWAGGN